ncbi:hypothetical protein [Haloarchaeobius baliensis]|uniref:hypothetical protein n=1 Tax=Haloarchaeobius baliensis TaxID=1670458 RepID=UPI003F880C7E
MTTLSGCSSLPGGGGGGGTPNGDRASYDSWMAAGVSEPVNAFTLDLEVYRTLQEEGEGTQTQTETSSSMGTDPLAGIPATYLFAAALGLGFGLMRTGLASLVQQDGSAQRAHFVDNGIVLEGSFDVESVGSSVSGAGAQEVDSHAGATLYRNGSGSDATVISVSGDTAVVVRGGENVSDPMARIRRLLDANAGNTDRFRGESDDYDSLVTALPTRGIMAVTYSSDGGLFESGGGGGGGGGGGATSGLASFSDLDLSGNAVGGATSASFSTERLESSVAILYESESEVDAKADIEAAVGGEAASSSVTIDGRMVYVEGTYEDPNTGN